MEPTNAGPSTSAPSTSHSNRISTAQFTSDAQSLAEFEKTVSSEKIAGYLSKFQTGGLVQSAGCILVIRPHVFQILAYSENCFEMLGVPTRVGPGLIGTDARKIFTPSSVATLTKAVGSRNLSFLNPILVQSYNNHKSFYAVLHNIDVGVIIDLEPAQAGHSYVIHADAVRSQKIAERAISKLKSLPRGSIGTLCDTVVEEVRKITGFDRVMVYKFHEDNHGEVISEARLTGLYPYVGLHYPATDIPEAARLLLKHNRVRMICDCNSEPVKVVQSRAITQPLCLVRSTLRAPHACHVKYMINMGSIASLVLAINVNDDVGSSMRLWGLVVCHHEGPWHVPLPLRSACRFLVQAFSMHLHLELQLAAQLEKERIHRVHTLLCDMLLRNPPHEIITQSPNIMDLVKCDGAALYYKGKSWSIGITPDESQVKDIVGWLMMTQGECTWLCMQSFADAGYPGAATLGDAVCGMAVARINSTDCLFWFRSRTFKEVMWGGAKHHPDNKDDSERMNPRTSFNAVMEVVKNRSSPWEAAEIGAIHSLQQIMRDSIAALEGSYVLDDQQQLVESSACSCQSLMLSILNNTGLGSMEASGWGQKEENFHLGSLINAIIHQGMILSSEKNLRLIHDDIRETIMAMCLCGDEIKLQFALSDFLVSIADYASSPNGWVEIKVSEESKLVRDGIEFVHLRFRIVHSGQGLPQGLVDEMFGRKSCETKQGVALNISQKIVRKMNGDVQYVRDQGDCYFQMDIQLKMGKNEDEEETRTLSLFS